MKQEITLNDVVKSMDFEIAIASHRSAKSMRMKSLEFNPSSLKYKFVRGRTDIKDKDINEYLDPLIAIEIYNKYDV